MNTAAYSGGEPAPQPSPDSAKNTYSGVVCLKHPNEWHSVTLGKYGRDFSAAGSPLLESDDWNGRKKSDD